MRLEAGKSSAQVLASGSREGNVAAAAEIAREMAYTSAGCFESPIQSTDNAGGIEANFAAASCGVATVEVPTQHFVRMSC